MGLGVKCEEFHIVWMEGADQEFASLFIDSFLIFMIQCNETGGPVRLTNYICLWKMTGLGALSRKE